MLADLGTTMLLGTIQPTAAEIAAHHTMKTTLKPVPGHLGISCVLGVFILDDGNVASSMQGLCKRFLPWTYPIMQGPW